MNIGSMRFRLLWRRYVSGGDGFGVPASFTDMGTFWGAVSPLSVNETIVADAQEAIATHTVTTRWIGNVKEKDHFVWLDFYPDGTNESKTLEIVSVLDTDSRHRELVMLVKQVRQP